MEEQLSMKRCSKEYKITIKCHPDLRGNAKEFPRPSKEWVLFINTQKVAEWWKLNL